MAQLVLTLVEFLRKLMEHQAIRRMDEKTLTPKQVEAVGAALMKLEETIREIGKLLLVLGLVLAAAGAVLLVGGKLPFVWAGCRVTSFIRAAKPASIFPSSPASC